MKTSEPPASGLASSRHDKKVTFTLGDVRSRHAAWEREPLNSARATSHRNSSTADVTARFPEDPHDLPLIETTP